MKYILLFTVLISSFSCAQDKRPLTGETEWQRDMNAQFKDALKSPLTEKDRMVFTALDFFKNDSAYVVQAKLKRTPDAKPFKMKTSSSRQPLYVTYGIATFKLNGKTHKLNVYQNVAMAKEVDYDNYLFLPFLDHTNGETTYSGGRYVSVYIPESDVLTINFNEAYNPYCAYSDRYSCPVVPFENYLKTEVNAGVKAFKKNK